MRQRDQLFVGPTVPQRQWKRTHREPFPLRRSPYGPAVCAKDGGFFELAIKLANRSPSDPRTLIRTARDFAVERPEFALAAVSSLGGCWAGNRSDWAGKP